MGSTVQAEEDFIYDSNDSAAALLSSTAITPARPYQIGHVPKPHGGPIYRLFNIILPLTTS